MYITPLEREAAQHWLWRRLQIVKRERKATQRLWAKEPLVNAALGGMVIGEIPATVDVASGANNIRLVGHGAEVTAVDASDQRTWWQRHAPEWLGGV